MIRTPAEAVEFLMQRVNFERTPPGGRTEFKLDRMRRLLSLLEHPQNRVPAVHIAGTKGKGSTAMMVAGALSASGVRTGLYTSPHLESFEERMRVDGAQPTAAEFVHAANQVARAVYILEQEPSPLEVTYFEAATAMAWLHFVDCNVQIVVLEVGLGGRLDATNLCRPVVTAITNISRDHTAILGDSPAEIAVEKAGIIKPGIPLVTGATGTAVLNVIRAACELNQAPFIETAGRFPFCRSGLEEKQGTHWVVSDSQLCRDTELPLENDSNNLPAANSRAGRWSVARRAQEQWEWFEVPLTGQHQTANAAVALELLKILHDQGWPVDTETIRRGWSTLRWPARIEQVHERPLILIDAAHNWAAVTALINTVREFTARRRILLFAGSREKDLGGMLRQFAPLFDTVVLTEFQSNPRATPLSHLQTIWQSCSDRPAHLKKNSQQALDFCLKIAQPDDLLCVTGSFFLAGELRSRILEWGTQAATRV